jgi:hypothetical protein
MNTTIRTPVAPGVYLVTRVAANVRNGEVYSPCVTHLRFETDSRQRIEGEWPVLSAFLVGLRSGSISEPPLLRDAIDEFVTRVELENTEGVEAPLFSAGRDNREEVRS